MNTVDKNFSTQIVRLPIKVLRVDKYQKKIREQKVKSIVKDFNPAALGLIHVSMRDDGSYWVFDGQHRVEALKRLGIDYVDCIIFTGLNYQDEASAFFGHHNVSKPNKSEEHNARRESGDITALSIENILLDLDLSFSNVGSDTKIASVKTVYDVYEKQGEKMLFIILSSIQQSFKNENTPFLANLINGLSDLFADYGDKVDKNWLIKALKKTSISDLNIKAEGFRDVHGFKKREAMKMAITRCYNHNKSERLKLK